VLAGEQSFNATTRGAPGPELKKNVVMSGRFVRSYSGVRVCSGQNLRVLDQS